LASTAPALIWRFKSISWSLVAGDFGLFYIFTFRGCFSNTFFSRLFKSWKLLESGSQGEMFSISQLPGLGAGKSKGVWFFEV